MIEGNYKERVHALNICCNDNRCKHDLIGCRKYCNCKPFEKKRVKKRKRRDKLVPFYSAPWKQCWNQFSQTFHSKLKLHQSEVNPERSPVTMITVPTLANRILLLIFFFIVKIVHSQLDFGVPLPEDWVVYCCRFYDMFIMIYFQFWSYWFVAVSLLFTFC